jgi:ATP-dependent helicase HrpA
LARVKPFREPLLPALCRAIYEVTGADVTESAFRVDAIPAYLRFNLRLVGERGELVAEDRDVAALIERYAGRAREMVRGSSAPAAWQRAGLTTWDFDALPAFVTRPLNGVALRAFPALVDRQASVELALFETEMAALTSHRAGVRRLVQLALKGALAALGKRAPAPFTRRVGLPAPRVEVEAFRELLLARVVDQAFELGDETRLPRDKAAFQRLLAAGTPRLTPTFEQLTRAVAAANAELDKTLRALGAAAPQPSAAAASADIRAQLEQLFPVDSLAWVDLERLLHFPRYLRAAQARLTRAIHDPRKDASKAEQLAPLWRAFLEKRVTARDQAEARRLHYSLEELRVAVFAPELKPLPGVTVPAVSSAVEALR